MCGFNDNILFMVFLTHTGLSACSLPFKASGSTSLPTLDTLAAFSLFLPYGTTAVSSSTPKPPFHQPRSPSSFTLRDLHHQLSNIIKTKYSMKSQTSSMSLPDRMALGRMRHFSGISTKTQNQILMVRKHQKNLN